MADDTLKPLVDTYIAEIEHRIKHYCNISKLPDDLLYVWASMTMDVVRVEIPNIEEIEDTVGGQANNVKVGDTSVSAGSAGNNLSNTAKSVIDKVVLDYRHDLHRYRRMRWG
ncbi:hypothetical protein D3C76_1263860 [compost metagenome]